MRYASPVGGPFSLAPPNSPGLLLEDGDSFPSSFYMHTIILVLPNVLVRTDYVVARSIALIPL
jgi:hypothetical protein